MGKHGIVGIVVLLILIGVIPSLSANRPSTVTTASDLGCDVRDEACQVWATFRANHPYPYQSFAATRLRGSRVC